MAFLVAVDETRAAECAFRRTLELAKRDDKIYVLCVVPDESTALLGVEGEGLAFIGMEYVSPVERRSEISCNTILRAAQLAARDAAKATLHKYGTLATSAGRDVTLLLGHGSVAETVANEAKRRGVETVVVGRRSLGSVARWFAGSESMKIVESAEVNVMIVHEQ
jgi:nucleotide-binding universal stress UspA family protein